MPPTPKPAERRQRRNKTGVGHILPAAPAELPACPKGSNGKPMLKATRDAWVAFWDSDVARLVDTRSDLPSLHRLFRLYDERQKIDNHVARHGRLTTGSTGQTTLDPLYKEQSSVDARITALEDRFGLTPLARLKLGVTFGQAAESLDRMNQDFGQDPDDADDDDPRLRAIPTTAS